MRERAPAATRKAAEGDVEGTTAEREKAKKTCQASSDEKGKPLQP